MIGGGMSHRMMGRRISADIPTPENGVCTVYPIPIPVTSGLLHYSSPFNWCDQYDDLAGTTPLPTSTLVQWRNSADISSSGNPQVPYLEADSRRVRYEDLGSGDVQWRPGGLGGTVTTSQINGIRAGVNAQTIIVLAKSPDAITVSNGAIGGHGAISGARARFQIRATVEDLTYNDGSFFGSTLFPNLGTYQVFSVRFGPNINLGLDKNYEVVKPTPVTPPPNSDFTLWSASSEFNILWNGRGRDVAIYDRVLSDSELETMIDYMKAKWNLI